MKHNRYGVANWFVRLAMDDQTIPLMGDGRILRDFVYVDDVIDALLLSAERPAADGEIFNVGCGKPIVFRDLAAHVVRIAGKGRVEYVPFTQERKALEPGDYYAAIGKISGALGWTPRVGLEEGLKRTIDYYRIHRARYWGEDAEER
jgi:UDP-glucose 4-epimerase